MTELRNCSQCHLDFPITDFYVCASNAGNKWRQRACKKCSCIKNTDKKKRRIEKRKKALQPTKSQQLLNRFLRGAA